MPKLKLPRKSTLIDMTAMCDMAFLLLNFFILTAKFQPDEAAIVDTPSSVSEIKLPDTDIMTITIDKNGIVYFGIDGQHTREQLIRKIGQKYKIDFTPEEIHVFSLTASVGLPVSILKQYLSFSAEERKSVKQTGIPIDSFRNELTDWVIFSRISNPKLRIAIKGDQDAAYPIVKQVMNTLQENKINKFNLITDLETAPDAVTVN